MSYLDDLKKKAQGVVNTVQNAYNTAQNVAGAVKSGVQNVYNAAQNAGQNVYNAATGNTQQPAQTQQAKTTTQPTTNWVDDYDAFENEKAMSAAGQGTTAPTTPAQGNENTAPSGMDLTQNSQWQSQLDDVMNKIMAGEKFNYDMNSDAMYQQYRDIYENQANMAMQNAMAQNAALTGGYGSSYGQMVGQQAYAQQMQGLNEIGLDLYDRAYNQYQNEQNNLYNQYAMLAEKEALDYNRDYQANRDTVADKQWQQAFDYQKAQDEIAQGQWQDTFDYQKEQDALAQENYQNQFDYQKAQDKLAQSNYENEFAYQQGRDEVADDQWLKQYEQWEKEYASSEAQREADNTYRDEAFQYQKSQDALAQENWQTSMDYQKEQDKLAQENWQAQFDESKAQNAADNAYRDNAFEYQKEMDKQNQTNYENEFAYQQSQDQQAQDNWLKQYEQWEKEYASSEEQRELDNQYRDSALEYQKEQDKQSQANWEAQFNESVNQNAADNKYREDVFNYQKEQDAQSQENWQASMDYQKEMDKQSQSNWQAEFDREGQWYDDAQEATKPTTKYEGEGALNGQEVPKQLAGTPGLTTTNPGLFDDNGYFKQAAVVESSTGVAPEAGEGTMTYSIGGKEVKVQTGTNPYTNTVNPDTKNGVMANGYQPDNYGGIKVGEPLDGRYTTINGVDVDVYSIKKDGKTINLAYDEANNKYIELDSEEIEKGDAKTSPEDSLRVGTLGPAASLLLK